MRKSMSGLYNEYAEKSEKPVTNKVYSTILNDFNLFIVRKLLEGHKVCLPSRMGTIYVKGKKIEVKFNEDGNVRNLAVDWAETNKLWNKDPEAKANKKLIYHLNSHTDNIRFKYHWSKQSMLVVGKSIYSLNMTRSNKRQLAKVIKNGDYENFMVTN